MFTSVGEPCDAIRGREFWNSTLLLHKQELMVTSSLTFASHLLSPKDMTECDPNMTLMWPSEPKAPGWSNSSYFCGSLVWVSYQRKWRRTLCVNELQAGFKGSPLLDNNQEKLLTFSFVGSWRGSTLLSNFILFFFFGITHQLREQSGFSGLFLNIYCISSSVLLYVECWKCYILYRMHYVISDLLFLYNQ